MMPLLLLLLLLLLRGEPVQTGGPIPDSTLGLIEVVVAAHDAVAPARAPRGTLWSPGSSSSPSRLSVRAKRPSSTRSRRECRNLRGARVPLAGSPSPVCPNHALRRSEWKRFTT